MGLTAPFLDALAALELTGTPDAPAIKAAYRRMVQLHPPDGDADAFRRVRSAYELLRDPGPRARELLLRPVPAIPRPPPPAGPAPDPGATALAVLRYIVQQADARALLGVDRPMPEAPTATGVDDG